MPIKSAAEMVAAAGADVPTVTPAEALAAQAAGTAVLVDVREPAEWAKGHAPGAIPIPRGLLEFAADPSLPTHRTELHDGRRIVLYCASAGRSAMAGRTLTEMGFHDVAHVAGGFNAWTQAGLPIEQDAASPTLPTPPRVAT